MAIKKRFSYRFCVFLLFCTLPLGAQTPQTAALTPQDGQDSFADKSYFTRETAEGILEVVQTITWPQADYVRYYEVSLEKQDENGVFEHFGTYKTEINEIEVTLKSGEYRYRVRLYNLLGKLAFETPFTDFSVKKAYIPALNDISPAVIYLDDIYDGSFTVRGINLLPLSVFTLKKLNINITADSQSVAQNGRSAAVTFNTALFDTGSWFLNVENPGGFTSEVPLDIRFIKWFDLTVSGGYAPLFVVFDKTIQTYFGTNRSFLGADARITFIAWKRRFSYLGAGLQFSWHRLGNNLPGYTLETNLFQAYALFTWRLPIIKNRFVFDVHGGPGVLAVQGLKFSFPHNLYSQPFTSLYVAATAGISFQVFIYKRLYIEAGADYSVAFIPDMSLMTVMPSLSVGWLF